MPATRSEQGTQHSGASEFVAHLADILQGARSLYPPKVLGEFLGILVTLGGVHLGQRGSIKACSDRF